MLNLNLKFEQYIDKIKLSKRPKSLTKKIMIFTRLNIWEIFNKQ